MKLYSKVLGLLLMASMVVKIVSPIPAMAAEEADQEGVVDLITADCAVVVSSEENPLEETAHYAVDGITNETKQWASGKMKDGVVQAETEQEPQWLVVDLGEEFDGEQVPVDTIKLWYNIKVWPMVYELQTSADNGEADEWETLVRVERNPFDGAVKNGDDQNIADETGNTVPGSAANTDTITKESTPNLKDNAVVERYVRFYVEKTNASAPGNNVCLREISIYTAAENVPDSGSKPEEPEPGERPWNLAEGQPVEASSAIEGTQAKNAVDGALSTRWNSENLKSFVAKDTSRDQEEQTPQWIQIDLGASGSALDTVRITYNAKVWAMDYVIQTTDTPEEDDSWTEVVHVTRPSANAFVTNDSGQNIADTAANTDTITTSSTPALVERTVGQYIRVYINKTNAQAPGGNNVNIAEIEILGTNPERHAPVDVDGALDGVTVSNPAAGDTKVTLPSAPEGTELIVRGSTLENVVTNDGSISPWNIGRRDVTLLLRLTEEGDKNNYAEKNVEITVPDHSSSYPAEWFPGVDKPNPKPEVIPTVQEWYGYEGDFTLTADSKIVLNDMANVGLKKAAVNMQADVEEICGVTLEIVNGSAPLGPHDIYIESLTDEATYDLGDEGYLMVTNEEGLHIYAPTYTGCLYGTITAEQILWQDEGHVAIPRGIMRDYPAYEVRGIKLDVARTPYRYEQLQDYAKIMLWYKMSEYDLHINDNDNANVNTDTSKHAGFHRLESETFPSMKSETKSAGIPKDLVNEDYYNNNEDYQGNPSYSKEEWRALAALCEDLGMYLLTEIDLPGHSLLYNKYAEENPDNIEWLKGGTGASSSTTGTKGYQELLDLTGENAGRALEFGQRLWDEYTKGDKPAIYGDIVHIGSDEYWNHAPDTNDAFAKFANEMRKVIQGNLGEDTKIRMWGAGSSSFSTAEKALGMTSEELASHFQLDIWYPGYDNAAKRTAEGYQVINCRDAFLYGNPGRSNRDVPNAEHLFYDWDPTMFGGDNDPLPGEPNLIGAKAVIWGDQSQEGMIEKDVHQRVLRAIAIVSEKTWGGTDEDDTFMEYELRASRLAEGPGTQIAMEIDSASSLVLDYDFANLSSDGTTVYDASGNGYDADLTGGSVSEDGWLTFDGDTLLETPLKTMSYPYTVSFDLKLSAEDGTANGKESSLFSGYDGRIQVAGHDGSMSADVNYFTRNFDYTVPRDGRPVNVTIVGTFQATRLYVNGQLVTFLSQKQDQDGLAPNAISTLYSSVVLPLEKIGQDFHGQMANIKVYDKAMSAEEIAAQYAGEDDGLVNVAQNAHAGGDSYETGDPYDRGDQRTHIAMKAVDGDAFVEQENASPRPDVATSEIFSYWQGDHADSALTIDLGQPRTISQVKIQWRSDGKGSDFQIQTSLNGENWTVAKEISGNQDFFETIEFDAPTEARYVRMQGTGSGNTYYIQEFLVYEQVDKAALNELLAQAERVVSEKGLDFESTGTDLELFQAVVFARAMSESPLATIAEVTAAAERLYEAMHPSSDTFTVQFDSNGGTEVPPQTVEHGGVVAEPAAPTRSGYHFVCWYADEGLTRLWSFSQPVNDDMTLYAKWDAVSSGGSGSTRYTVSVEDTDNGSVKVSPTRASKGSTVTVTVKPDEGYELDKLTVTDKNGDSVKLTDKGDGKYTFKMPASKVTVEAVFTAVEPEPEGLPFTDVTSGDWFYDAVAYVYDKGMMEGTTDTTFAPTMNLTRSMIAQVLYNLEERPEAPGAAGFPDVAAGAWYADAVNWAAARGIVKGYDTGAFGPEDSVTREQLAAILYRYAQVKGYDTTQGGMAVREFSDSASISDWAQEAMAWAVNAQVLSGKGNGVLDPQGTVTRAEVAQMLMNFGEHVG